MGWGAPSGLALKESRDFQDFFGSLSSPRESEQGPSPSGGEAPALREGGPTQTGLTHPEGGVQRTPASALGLLWTCGALRTLETSRGARIRPPCPCLECWGWVSHRPPLPHIRCCGGNPETWVSRGPSPAR